MSFLGLATGTHALIVGVEPDPDEPELTRVYLGSRHMCQYVLVSGDSAESVKNAWNSAHHVTAPWPSSVYVDDDERARIVAARDDAPATPSMPSTPTPRSRAS